VESCRTWYGRALLELARRDPAIVALDADLSKSTMSTYIEQEFPERFIEVGIAEQDMVGIAAGLALAGLKPFAHSFAVFITGRAYDQVRQAVAYPNLNVKLVGSSAGLSDFGDGATHQSIEDVSLMRALPNMTVIVPADHIQTRAATLYLGTHTGPAYLRVSRTETEAIFPEDYVFKLGKVDRLVAGSDVAIVASGPMTATALDASRRLASIGISASVACVSTLKPLDTGGLIDALSGIGNVITLEEHSVYGGLGSTVAELLGSTGGYRVHMMGVKDRFGQSAESFTDLLDCYGLTADDAVEAARRMVERRL
jgi:transketolase